jgi:hypothetical protein
LAVVVSVAKGYDLGYIWKTKARPSDVRRAAITSVPRRPGNRPAVRSYRPGTPPWSQSSTACRTVYAAGVPQGRVVLPLATRTAGKG